MLFAVTESPSFRVFVPNEFLFYFMLCLIGSEEALGIYASCISKISQFCGTSKVLKPCIQNNMMSTGLPDALFDSEIGCKLEDHSF